MMRILLLGQNKTKTFTIFILLWMVLLSPALLATTEDERNTIQIFKQASASVVNISSSQYRRNLYTYKVTERPRGAGTGIVWDKEGHILTNFHVVQGADKLIVSFGTTPALEAELIGGSAAYDIAVLKVDVDEDYPFSPLAQGDSDVLEVGNRVLAIGNPFGFDTSLSAGVVSAVGREITTPNGILRNAIQTDAAINPGNSGGPLINSAGDLVGMSVLIYSPSGASVGIGFAIPINTIKRIAPKLIEYGRVPRAYLGIEYRSDQWARQLGVVSGVPIVRVLPGTPAYRVRMKGIEADRRGFRLQDIVIGIDNRPVADTEDLQRLLEDYRSGDTVKINVSRDQELHDYEVKFNRD